MKESNVHIHGDVNGLIIGDHNKVRLEFNNINNYTPPFLAPSPTDHKLFGRGKILTKLRKLLISDKRIALSSLKGLPGVGKTAIAIELANDSKVLREFSDGVLWAGLGRKPDMFALLGTWAIALGITSETLAGLRTINQRAKSIRSVIGLRNILIVIDDAWSIKDALTFKIGGVNCAYILTTRFNNIAAMFSIRNATKVPELPKNDSYKLLVTLAPKLINYNRKLIDDLLEATGYLPLAIILIGNHIRVKTNAINNIQSILEYLTKEKNRLGISQAQSPIDHHPSLSPHEPISLMSIIGLTYDSMAKNEQSILLSLALLPPKPNSFSLSAAMAISENHPDEFSSICNAGLIEYIGKKRYTIHQSIVDYTQEKNIKDFHYKNIIKYFADFSQANFNNYNNIELEINNIDSSIFYAKRLNSIYDYITIANSISGYYIDRGLYKKLKENLQQEIDFCIEHNDQYNHSIALFNFGCMEWRKGNAKVAENSLLKSIKISKKVKNNEYLCRALLELGTIKINQGDYKNAKDYLSEAKCLADNNHDTEITSMILLRIGSLYAHTGSFVESEKYLLNALKISKDNNSIESAALILQNLSSLKFYQGELIDSEKYASEGLVLSKKSNNHDATAILLVNLGWAHEKLQKYETSEKYFKEGIEVATASGNQLRLIALHEGIGCLYGRLNNFPKAHNNLNTSLSFAKKYKQTWHIAGVLNSKGDLYIKDNDWDNAKKVLEKALILSREHNIPKQYSTALYRLAKIDYYFNNDIYSTTLKCKECISIFKNISDGLEKEAVDWLNEIGVEI